MSANCPNTNARPNLKRRKAKSPDVQTDPGYRESLKDLSGMIREFQKLKEPLKPQSHPRAAERKRKA